MTTSPYALCSEVKKCSHLAREADQKQDLPSEFTKFYKVVEKNVRDIASLRSQLSSSVVDITRLRAQLSSSVSRINSNINSMKKGKPFALLLVLKKLSLRHIRFIVFEYMIQ